MMTLVTFHVKILILISLNLFLHLLTYFFHRLHSTLILSTEPTSVSDMRPIHFLCSLSKGFELLKHKQFSRHLSKHKMLVESQSGFRRSHSTTTAIIKVSDDIRECIDRKHYVVLVLLDFSKAFDCIDHVSTTICWYI